MIADAFIKNGIDDFIILNNQLAIINVDDDFKESKLDKIVQIAWWQRSLPMSSLIEITNNLMEGESVTTASGVDDVNKNPYTNLTGKNIIVAIIDSGIDYLHPDFIDNDGRSRIISIWDQESDKGKPPKGIPFGSEFSNEDINKAILEKDSSLSQDRVGTGTLAAGIAVGNGRKNTTYKGVANKSQLIVVKLKEYKDIYEKGKKNYEEADFLAAIKYIIDTANKEKKPTVINLTVAAMSNSVTDTNILDLFDFFSNTGVIVVSGAGNEGNTDIHYEGKFKDLNSEEDIIIQIGDQENIDIVLNTVGPNKISAMLISPAGEAGYTIKYSPDNNRYSGKFNMENTFYSMRYVYPFITSGAQNIYIQLKDVKPGVWTLRLTPEEINSGVYDIYLPNKNIISDKTRFLDPSSIATMTKYATGNNVITVGTYNDKTDSMWLGSSKGPIRGKRTKPDIVAPGVDIIGTYTGGSYNTGTGTGVSSSIVSGVIVLLIEYLIEQSENPKLSLSTEVIKTYLMLGTTKKNIYKYPNISQGYGILNLKKTIEEISSNI